MKLNKILGVIFIGIAVSCKPVLFDAPAGKMQSQFPAEMQGAYYLLTPKSTGSFFSKKTNDTVFVNINTNSIWQLGTDTIITNLDTANRLGLVQNSYYVMAKQHTEWQNYWSVYFLLPNKNQVTVYGILNPQPLDKYFSKQFIGMHQQQDSVFVHHQNDSILKLYFEKELKPNQGLKLHKIVPKK